MAVEDVEAPQEEGLADAAAVASAVAVEEVVDSVAVATLARADSRAVEDVAGEVVASAGEVVVDGKADRQCHGIISEFSICRWDIQKIFSRLGRFSAFRKRKGASLLSKDLCKRLGYVLSCDRIQNGC